jgi:predicted acylesterase/phospholipase RssA
LLERAKSLIRRRKPAAEAARPRIALALGGGGVTGGMFEVGVLAALEERLNGEGRGFDVYVGCSAGSVVASLLASGVRASDLYRILDGDVEDPLNFRRGAVFSSGSFKRAAGYFWRFAWAITKNAMAGFRLSVPDVLARGDRTLPAGFFSLEALERFVRDGLESRGGRNRFEDLEKPLFIPAIDLDTAERVVFGQGDLREVPISRAVAASSAIPGFFEPYTIAGRDYVDGGVGFSGHADLAAEAGADIVFVVHPLVPSLNDAEPGKLRARGLYHVLEQASRIYGQNLLRLGLAVLPMKYPGTRFYLLEPPRSKTPLFGPTMGFEASRAALHYGYESTKEWLAGDGRPLLEHLLPRPVPVAACS